MATYAGRNIDEATDAWVYMGIGLFDATYHSRRYEGDEYKALGPERIIDIARRMQEENPDKEVAIMFGWDDADGMNIVEGYIHDEPVE